MQWRTIPKENDEQTYGGTVGSDRCCIGNVHIDPWKMYCILLGCTCFSRRRDICFVSPKKGSCSHHYFVYICYNLWNHPCWNHARHLTLSESYPWDIGHYCPQITRWLATGKAGLISIHTFRPMLWIIQARRLGPWSIRRTIVGTWLRWGSVESRALALIGIVQSIWCRVTDREVFRPKDSAVTSWGVALLFFSSLMNSAHWINLIFSCCMSSSMYAAWN